ncbi:MAG: DJ-1/PfpI family protein, partial [Saprospiraceae bacterium]
MMKVGVLLFENFETLDVFGPVEILGRLTEEYQIYYYSLVGGLVTNQHGIKIMSERLLDEASALDIFLLPGGPGTRVEVHNRELISAI